MAHTGKKCDRSGIYQSNCSHKIQIALSKGDTFPPCREGNHGVSWTLLRATHN